MKIVLRVLSVAALVAVGVWLWTVLFPSPEKVIRQRLATVAKRASFTADESALARLADAESLAGYFSTNVEIDLDVPGRFQHHHHWVVTKSHKRRRRPIPPSAVSASNSST